VESQIRALAGVGDRGRATHAGIPARDECLPPGQPAGSLVALLTMVRTRIHLACEPGPRLGLLLVGAASDTCRRDFAVLLLPCALFPCAIAGATEAASPTPALPMMCRRVKEDSSLVIIRTLQTAQNNQAGSIVPLLASLAEAVSQNGSTSWEEPTQDRLLRRARCEFHAAAGSTASSAP
jgi:hypothetical protein